MTSQAYITVTVGLALALISCESQKLSTAPSSNSAQARRVTAADLEIDSDLRPYYKAFIEFTKEASLKINPDRRMGLRLIVREPILGKKGQNASIILGRCYEESEESGALISYDLKIAIAPDAEEKMGLLKEKVADVEGMLRFLVFHELGHCLGGLDHTPDDAPRKQMPIAIMDAFVPSSEVALSLPWQTLKDEFADYWRAGQK